MSNAEYIITHLSESELLAQLAEEAGEVVQASLKLRRVLDGTNPTPVTEEQARVNLEEEYNDVECVKHLLNLVHFDADADNVFRVLDDIFPKLERWRKRLEARDDSKTI